MQCATNVCEEIGTIELGVVELPVNLRACIPARDVSIQQNANMSDLRSNTEQALAQAAASRITTGRER